MAKDESYQKIFEKVIVGNRRQLIRRLVVPQVFVFIILILLDSLYGGVDTASTSLRLLAIGYVVACLMGLYLSSDGTLRVSHVRLELTGLALILGAVSLVTERFLVFDFYVPLSVVTLALLRINLTTAGTLVILGPVLLIGLVTGGTHYLLTGWEAWLGGGFALLLLSFGVVLGRAVWISGRSSEESSDEGYAYGGDSEHEPTDLKAPLMNLAPSVKRVQGSHLRALKAEFYLVLPTVLVLVGGMTFGVALSKADRDLWFAIGWLGVGVAQLILLTWFARVQTLRALYVGALMLFLGLLAWWAWLSAFGLAPPLYVDLVLAVIIFAAGLVPWQRPYLSLIALLLLLAAVLRCFETDYPLVLGVGLVALITITLRGAAYRAVGSFVRVVLPTQLLPRAGGERTDLELRLLAWKVVGAAQAHHAVIIAPTGSVEILNGELILEYKADVVFGRGLYQRCLEERRFVGVLAASDLGGQYLPVWLDWFGDLPKQLLFVRVNAIIDGREQPIILVVPLTISARLAGIRRTLEMLGNLAVVEQQVLLAMGRRSLSSDQLVESQESVSERERQLNQVIHLVNNTAQDVSIDVEKLRAQFTDNDEDHYRPELEELIQRIELSIRGMSAYASDMKRVQELLRGQGFRDIEVVPLEAIVEELQVSARYFEIRRGGRFTVEVDQRPDLGVRVINRELLGSVLRLLLQAAGRRIAGKGKVRIAVRVTGDRVHFLIGDDGAEVDADMRRYLSEPESHTLKGAVEMDHLRTARRFAGLSGGRLSYSEPEGPLLNQLDLELQVEKVAARTSSVEPGQWVLLVDDREEVTIFYSRVAHALSLKYFTAASVVEAIDIVEREGRPRLVITDIELGEHSGVDLVKDLRQRFGTDLPVIVVSGHTGDELVEQLESLGTSRYLTKPVGRRKLFFEIQELLAE